MAVIKDTSRFHRALVKVKRGISVKLEREPRKAWDPASVIHCFILHPYDSARLRRHSVSNQGIGEQS